MTTYYVISTTHSDNRSEAHRDKSYAEHRFDDIGATEQMTFDRSTPNVSAPTCVALNRLCERMIRLGFPPTDPLYMEAVKARAAMQDLHTAAHYASCKHGVGRPGKG